MFQQAEAAYICLILKHRLLSQLFCKAFSHTPNPTASHTLTNHREDLKVNIQLGKYVHA